MRPASIVTFERLYLVALGLGLVNSLMSLDRLRAMLAAEPAVAQLELGEGLIWASIGLSLAIPLLLWHLVAHRASSVARWILVLLTAFGLTTLPGTLRALGEAGGLGVMVSLAVEVLRVVAVAFLFRADARDWLAGGGADAQG